MKLYIDESGNTGQTIVDAGGLSNYAGQPFFGLGGLLLTNEDENKKLEIFVQSLIGKYRIQSAELKASGLYERKPDFILELFAYLNANNIAYFLEVMDKKYYLAMQITNSCFLPLLPETDDQTIHLSRTIAEHICRMFPESVFHAFTSVCMHPTKDAFDAYLDKLDHVFRNRAGEDDELFQKAIELTRSDFHELLAEEGLDAALNRMLPAQDVDKKNRLVKLLPHSHAFTNIIARCEKYRQDKRLPEFEIIHDEQAHFDEILRANIALMRNVDTDEYLKDTFIAHQSIYSIKFDLPLIFQNSKTSVMLQVADVITGFLVRAWNDFFYGNFKSLNRYIPILQGEIFDTKRHQSVGINLVVPAMDFELLRRHLVKF